MLKLSNFFGKFERFRAIMSGSEVILNELLCYISNKIDVLDHDTLVLLCLQTFDYEKISNAKTRIRDICSTLDLLGTLRYPARTGQGREKRSI